MTICRSPALCLRSTETRAPSSRQPALRASARSCPHCPYCGCRLNGSSGVLGDQLQDTNVQSSPLRSLTRPNPQGGPHRSGVPDAGPNNREARKAHAARYAEDDVKNMVLIPWPPMTTLEPGTQAPNMRSPATNVLESWYSARSRRICPPPVVSSAA